MPIEIAIDLLKMWEQSALSLNSENGYWLAYSGGKDSDCILELAKMAGVKYHPAYSVTTIDPPELVRYIRREHPEVDFKMPKENFFTRLATSSRGPPTRLKRWCCYEYKEQSGAGHAKIIGVRIEESARRAKLWRQIVPDRKLTNGIFICPICYWTEEDVWEFHSMRNLAYCELYDEGFKRLGCIGCPMSGCKGKRRDFNRWPRYEMLWKRAVKRYWDNYHGTLTSRGKTRVFDRFNGWEQLWDWWVQCNGMEEFLECQGSFLNFSGIDDIDDTDE